MSKIFETAYIYKISGGGLTYYGSTKNFKSRKIGHKANFTAYSKGQKQKYLTSAEVMKTGSAKFEVIETLHNISKHDLQRKERDYILNNPCVNKYAPATTKTEKTEQKKVYDEKYRQENIDYLKKRKAEYRKHNISIIQAKQKEVLVCDLCKSSYQRSNKSQHEKSQKHKKELAKQLTININLSNSSNNTISITP